MSRYDRELVERLLPAVWDESYAYGMEAPLAPPPGMPRAKADPSKGNTLWAHLSDIRTAWRMAPIREQPFARCTCDISRMVRQL